MRIREVLEAKVQYLENDRGIEEELRNRFDVAKEGEQVVILLDRKDKKKEEDLVEDVISNSREGVTSEDSVLNTLKFWD